MPAGRTSKEGAAVSRLTRALSAPRAQEPAGREILTEWQIPRGRFSGTRSLREAARRPTENPWSFIRLRLQEPFHTAEAENTDLKLRSNVPCFWIIDCNRSV